MFKLFFKGFDGAAFWVADSTKVWSSQRKSSCMLMSLPWWSCILACGLNEFEDLLEPECLILVLPSIYGWFWRELSVWCHYADQQGCANRVLLSYQTHYWYRRSHWWRIELRDVGPSLWMRCPCLGMCPILRHHTQVQGVLDLCRHFPWSF